MMQASFRCVVPIPSASFLCSNPGETRSAIYFGAALDAAAHASFVLQSVAAEQTTDLDPSKFAFVVLSDTMTLPAIFEHALSAYVAKGGSVLIALGTSAARHAADSFMGRQRSRGARLRALGQPGDHRPGRFQLSRARASAARPRQRRLGRGQGLLRRARRSRARPVSPRGSRTAHRCCSKSKSAKATCCCSLRVSTT